MNELQKALFAQARPMAPAGDDDGSAAAAAVDRGDEHGDHGDQGAPRADAAPRTAADASSAKAADGQDGEAEGDARARDDRGRFIPKERFDEAVKKERGEKEELARRLKAFEDREAQARVADDFTAAQKAVKDLIKQHTSLLADGEIDRAADLMEKILDLKESIAERRAEARALSAKDSAKAEIAYDAAVERLEHAYPQIDPEHETFDRAAVRKIQALMSGLIQAERLSPARALAEAVETILGKPADKGRAGAERAEEVGMRRKEEAVKRAVDAARKQPASTREVGLDHDKQGGPLDASAVAKMSWDEFVKLPESKLSELRGDFV